LQCIDQIKQRNLVEQAFIFCDFDRRTGLTAKRIPPEAFLIIQLRSGLLELLIFKQSPNQFLSGIGPVFAAPTVAKDATGNLWVY